MKTLLTNAGMSLPGRSLGELVDILSAFDAEDEEGGADVRRRR